jgi:hypothetical protein
MNRKIGINEISNALASLAHQIDRLETTSNTALIKGMLACFLGEIDAARKITEGEMQKSIIWPRSRTFMVKKDGAELAYSAARIGDGFRILLTNEIVTDLREYQWELDHKKWVAFLQ